MVGSIRSEMNLVTAPLFKSIIFAPTAALADYYGHILQEIPGMPPVSILHSRVTQSKRTKVTEEFRQSNSGILVATDVVARGMDFPRVTNVFQVGLPADKESYIHRLGRTARAGAEGRGTFIIAEPETFFSKWTLKEITFEPTPADLTAKGQVMDISEKMESHAKTYQAWLGYYKNHMKGMNYDTAGLVAAANTFARNGLGAPETPGLQKSVVGKMGLKGVKGLKIIPDAPRPHHNRGGGEGRPGAGRKAGNGGFGGGPGR